MKVYDIIDMVETIRPGNVFEDKLLLRWLSECDASLQLEVTRKKPYELKRLVPEKWDRGLQYKTGDRVSHVKSGKVYAYTAKENNISADPCDNPDVWTEAELVTYVGFPHDNIYYLYLIAMMDFANMEYDKYANDSAMYESAVDEFAKWWQRTYSNTQKEGVDEYEVGSEHSY